MNLEIVRRIRGNVHGTIDVTVLENAVLNHRYVQRLRRIRQLAFLHYVFPGATHSRFEHSLGVMQLAGIAWGKLKVNQRRVMESATKISNFPALEKEHAKHGQIAPTFNIMNQVFDSTYNLQVLRLAGLLHDIGHSPFSHSGERFLPSWKSVYEANKSAPVYIKEFLVQQMDRLSLAGKDPSQVRVRHEVFSLFLIEKVLTETYRDNPQISLTIDPQDVISVIAPDVKPSQNSPLRANGVYQLLNELISGELDIDRMDYLLRDSRECGVVYGNFDAGRILDGLCTYFDDTDNSLHVAISSSGLAAFEDYLRARQSMYLQVYFHKTSASGEAMMQSLSKKLGGWTLPSTVEDYASIDEYNIGSVLEHAANERITDIFEKKEFEKTLADLLLNRNLWKLVFQTKNSEADSLQRFEKVRAVLQTFKHDWEQVSSSTTLTRFRPRSPDEPSKNYLRLIVKDDFDVPTVVPIEDQSRIIADNNRVTIQRLYLDGGDLNSEKAVIESVRKKINEVLSELK